jgi:uncharacterized protein (TIGR03382 family)
MKTSIRTRRRGLWIAAALASTLVAVPAADARPDPGGAGAGNQQVAVEPESSYVPFVTDFPRTAPAPGGDASPLGYRHALPQDYGVVPVEVVRAPSTFDWGDAFIGAGGTLALLLLAGGAALARRHVSRPSAA